ncbi:hypothetical protein [Longimicrobium terrae]|uniref:Uncharacterized protein n=1 Tax=Longimicrobium terrae TaxID=1639882 RepID=A0A841GXC6_9BACT|nr:hypothetical protein [Longimicrobium terrae]MBB4635552.1 hypothetical protein [Longimicrobium terrae]MBB6069946.1 hypothetical protein [Longimicrobium terrae]NNC32859.1 hypothetical protein [Longimicrobium terrae]
MRLDISALDVQSFAVAPASDLKEQPADTGRGGPDSYCWICYNTGNTVPSCMGYQCGVPATDTFVDPACGYA